MKSFKQTIHSSLTVLLLCGSVPVLNAQSGEQTFHNTCQACHTIGGGRLVGPDLSGITSKRSEAWLTKWIKSSQSMINSGDADAVAIFNEYNKVPMPDQNLSDADIKSLLAYIHGKGGASASTTVASSATSAPQSVTKSSDNASADDITLGQHLFEGDVRLSSGGPACISCHNVGSDRVIPGGLLAKDLTGAYSRMGGDVGLSGILNAPPFPAMTQAYKNHPMTDKEIFALVSFLNKVEKENGAQPLTFTSPLLKWGFVGLIAWIILILILWHNRKKDTVKKKIFERQIKSSY